MLCAADARARQVSKLDSLLSYQPDRAKLDRANICPTPSLPPCLDPAAAGLRDSAHVPPYILAKAFGDNGNFLKHQRRPSEAAEEMAAMAARQNGAKK